MNAPEGGRGVETIVGRKGREREMEVGGGNVADRELRVHSLTALKDVLIYI